MRKAITLGLLAAALIPLSIHHHSYGKAEQESTGAGLGAGGIAAHRIERAMFTAARNAEIRRSLAAYERGREARKIEALNREIATSLERAKAHREADFAAARNAEIRRSLAAYEGARDIRFAAARNAEARRSLAAYENARAGLIADAYRRELALVAARYAEMEISIARARNESLLATLARLAPHIGTTNALTARAAATSPIETASIEKSVVIGPCATSSP